MLRPERLNPVASVSASRPVRVPGLAQQLAPDLARVPAPRLAQAQASDLARLPRPDWPQQPVPVRSTA